MVISYWLFVNGYLLKFAFCQDYLSKFKISKILTILIPNKKSWIYIWVLILGLLVLDLL
jgi:hypothetical protein